MAARGGGQGDQSDNAYSMLWTIAAIFIFGAIIWYVFKDQIIHAYFVVKIWEIKLVSYFTDDLIDVQTAILAADTSKLSFKEMLRFGDVVGVYLRIPIVVLILIMGFIVYFANSTRHFKRVYDMAKLAELEKVNWPQITPVLGLKLDKQDINKGRWAMALTPMQFCKRHKLLIEQAQKTEGIDRKNISVKLNRGQASKIFSIQLGQLFEGIDRLPPYVKALYAVFVAKHHSDTKVTEKILIQLSKSSIGKLNVSGVDAVCKKYSNSGLVKHMVKSHAYVLTFMASMLEAARLDGVQASADFLWLKPIDRKLWYMLNTVGRQTPFVEVAGPFSHWNAEKQIGRRLLVPMVEEATNALEVALSEVVYHKDAEE